MKDQKQLIDEIVAICDTHKMNAIQSKKYERCSKLMKEQKELIQLLADKLHFKIHFEGDINNVDGGIITSDGIFIGDL